MPRRRISTGMIVPRVTEDGTVEVLLQYKRKLDAWEIPGGKLDGTESVEECAWRELIEETDLNAYLMRFHTYVENSRYCCMVFVAEKWSRTPQISEPDKHAALGWFPLNDPPVHLTKLTKLALATLEYMPPETEEGRVKLHDPT